MRVSGECTRSAEFCRRYDRSAAMGVDVHPSVASNRVLDDQALTLAQVTAWRESCCSEAKRLCVRAVH